MLIRIFRLKEAKAKDQRRTEMGRVIILDAFGSAVDLRYSGASETWFAVELLD